MAQSVAVVGAGLCGLTAAKTLMQSPDAEYQVTVFERTDRLGGLWPTSIDEEVKRNYRGFISPLMPTNLSRFTVMFSDLAWEEVHRAEAEKNKSPVKAPAYPPAWQAGRYLAEYQKKFIPGEVFRWKCEVVHAELTTDKTPRWQLTVLDHSSSKRETMVFDRIVVASGFFARPQSLNCKLTGLDSSSNSSEDAKIVHSSSIRSLADVVPSSNDHTTFEGKKLLVVGGANSAGETAASLAVWLSSEQNTTRHWTSSHWSHSGQSDNTFKGVKVYHVTPRPIYAIPEFLPAPPTKHNKAAFIPFDIAFYDFEFRPEGEIKSSSGLAPDSVTEMLHGAVQGMIGSDQGELNAPALVNNKDKGAIHCTLSDNYSEFVRAGMIVPVQGRLESLERSQEPIRTFKAKLSNDSEIDEVIGVVHANGFTPTSGLSFLSSSVRDAMGYDETSNRLPIYLSDFQTSNPAVPSLAFVGFYEGPYWGIVEMQARIIARRWSQEASNGTSPAITPEKRFGADYENTEKLSDLRQAMKARAKDVPQYWFSDYLGYMEEVARELGLPRVDGEASIFGQRDGAVTPARYLTPDSTGQTPSPAAKEHSQATLASLQAIIADPQVYTIYTGQVVSRAIQGHWKINRMVQSALPSMPSGHFTGTARFLPRASQLDEVDRESLYIEEGTLRLGNGSETTASRRYAWRYSELGTPTGQSSGGEQVEPGLSVWFIKPEDSKTVDYLYHQIDFLALDTNNPSKDELSEVEAKALEGIKGNVQKARAHHLCEEDTYKTLYAFEFRGVSIDKWLCRHEVSGPAKSYTSDTWYTRH